MFYRWTFLIFVIFLFTTAPVSNFAYAEFELPVACKLAKDRMTILEEELGQLVPEEKKASGEAYQSRMRGLQTPAEAWSAFAAGSLFSANQPF